MGAWWDRLSLWGKAVVAGVVWTAFVSIVFIAGQTNKLIWKTDPVGLVIVPGVIGAAFEGVIVCVVAYVIGWLLARRKA